jgi:predicted TPR repeat methyltransferase
MANILKDPGKVDDAEAYKNRGNVLINQGKLDEAAIQYEQAIILRPDYAEAYNNLGNVRKEKGRLDDAITLYEQAIALRPDNVQAHCNLGSALRTQGKLDEAIASYERAIALKPNFAEAYSNLGNALKDQGRLDEAVTRYEQAIALKPGLAEIRINLGAVLMDQDKHREAMGHLRCCLELDPSDSHGARLLLARLGCVSMPERASDAHLHRLYAQRVNVWDHNCTASHPYRGHELVAEALNRVCGEVEKLDILDVGCGTGLVGNLIKKRAKRLEGIDLSPLMVEKANAKGVYDKLHQGDLVTFMAGQREKYDVITCAATLIHFGDLRPVFRAVAIALRNDGVFIATLFPNDDEQDGNGVAVAPSTDLAMGGCYVHGRSYIRRLAEESGLNVEVLNTEVHEYHNDKPMMGLVIVLRRYR